MNIKQHHAIMFHHLHDGEKHPASQGSLSATQLRKMIEWLSERYNLLSASEFIRKSEDGSIDESDICLSFDDGLKCQIDIAAPILKEMEIGAFFFVYSGIYGKNPNYLEIYRYFRTTQFKNIDLFYEDFFCIAEENYQLNLERVIKNFEQEQYLLGKNYLSRNDRIFRFIRDKCVPDIVYSEIMKIQMARRNFSPAKIINNLWMSEEDIRNLGSEGHVVGLHSYNHPTNIGNLDYDQQYQEYALNSKHLCRLVNTRPYVMAHPCGRYSAYTLKILTDMGITMGFRSDMLDVIDRSNLEIPRRNHAEILAKITE